MEGTLASTLGAHPVMTASGQELGTLVSLTMDPATGRLATLRVDPTAETAVPFDRNEDGHLQVPAERVTGQEDYVVVARGSGE